MISSSRTVSPSATFSRVPVTAIATPLNMTLQLNMLENVRTTATMATLPMSLCRARSRSL